MGIEKIDDTHQEHGENMGTSGGEGGEEPIHAHSEALKAVKDKMFSVIQVGTSWKIEGGVYHTPENEGY